MKDDLQNKKEAALKATLELVAERGFQGAPMSQIAQRANIGMGTIYRYFTGKDDLVNALYLEVKIRLTRSILKSYQESAALPKGFRQLIGSTVRYFIENPAELSFTEQYENSPLITAATREEAARISGPTAELFSRAMEQGLLKDLPLEVIGALISGATISLAKVYSSGVVQLDEVLLTASIDAIWNMVSK